MRSSFVLDSRIIDCSDLYARPGYYPGVKPLGMNPENKSVAVHVACDAEGWTVIQSRGQFGSPVDYFLRGWDEYVQGFGEPGMIPVMSPTKLEIPGALF